MEAALKRILPGHFLFIHSWKDRRTNQGHEGGGGKSGLNEQAAKAVEGWFEQQTARAFKEHYFAMTFGPQDEIGPALSNYHLWWEKIKKAIDPNGITPSLTALV